jgi:hypothetical protein
MLLPFTDSLVITKRCDAECAILADRHYTRQTPGSREFMGNGTPLVLRNAEGTVVFGWLKNVDGLRADGERGYNCVIFRNESSRRSSEIILEAEQLVFDEWGTGRLFTYIDPKRLRTIRRRGREFCRWPAGRCFLEAGWSFVRITKKGKHLLQKSGIGEIANV